LLRDAGCKALSRVFDDFRAAVCAQRPLGIRPPKNIDSSRAVRRFMPGGLLAELVGIGLSAHVAERPGSEIDLSIRSAPHPESGGAGRVSISSYESILKIDGRPN
jgi:hypothetical protein